MSLHELRRRFHLALDDTEEQIRGMGAAARDLFEQAVQALDDPSRAGAVIAGDDRVDAYWIGIEQQILDLFALEAPVAGDLRLLTALLHISLHLERVADMAVNIAKISRLTESLPRHEAVLRHVEEMGSIALELLDAAMEAFVRRDPALAHRLSAMDERLDHLNRIILPQILTASDDRGVLEWAVEMHLVARLIERVGDHAVDIGEQVAYLVTGVFEEFCDASHPTVRS